MPQIGLRGSVCAEAHKDFHFSLFKTLLLYFGCAGSSLLCRLFSSCGKWGLLSSCGVKVLLLQSTDSRAHRLQ